MFAIEIDLLRKSVTDFSVVEGLESISVIKDLLIRFQRLTSMVLEIECLVVGSRYLISLSWRTVGIMCLIWNCFEKLSISCLSSNERKVKLMKVKLGCRSNEFRCEFWSCWFNIDGRWSMSMLILVNSIFGLYLSGTTELGTNMKHFRFASLELFGIDRFVKKKKANFEFDP